ncbi:MAG TPA: hypothetical protein VE396_08255 [Xanthobacteraceae bacterium]|nr:hypothetical protein [Xanthobacteraceae bacterium]
MKFRFEGQTMNARQRLPIPRHEPEVIKAGARLHFGDDEKVATTSFESIAVNGVKLNSRYGKAHELELMRAFVLDLPESLCRLTATIFCDSKATNSFSITLRHWTVERAKLIGRAIAESALARNGGHNGITLCPQDRRDPDNFFGDFALGRVDIDLAWNEYGG